MKVSDCRGNIVFVGSAVIDGDFVSRIDQLANHIRPDRTRSADYQDSHETLRAYYELSRSLLQPAPLVWRTPGSSRGDNPASVLTWSAASPPSLPVRPRLRRYARRHLSLAYHGEHQ